MPTETEIEAAADQICIIHTGRSLEMTNPQNRIDIRKAAKLALEAAEKVRAAEKRAACTHPARKGSGFMCSDGSSKYDWFCPDCGASGSHETKADPNRQKGWPIVQNLAM